MMSTKDYILPLKIPAAGTAFRKVSTAPNTYLVAKYEIEEVMQT